MACVCVRGDFIQMKNINKAQIESSEHALDMHATHNNYTTILGYRHCMHVLVKVSIWYI